MNKMLDAHIHSIFSDGGLQLEEIVEIGRKKGFDIGISDHVGTMYPLNNECL